MATLDEQLSLLSAQIRRRKELEPLVQNLQQKVYSMETQVKILNAENRSRQEAAMEKPGLKGLIQGLTGRQKAQQEAEQAAAEYREAAEKLRDTEAELDRYRTELSSFYGCQERYDALMEEKAQALKEAGGEAADQLYSLEERTESLRSQQGELHQAISAGTTALYTADAILSDLDSAKGYGMWDVAAGGLIADLAKHSHLDNAQDNMERLQSQVNNFRSELADVDVSGLQVSIGGALKVADFLCDGIVPDLMVLQRISQSQRDVEDVRSQIFNILSRLKTLKSTVDAELETLPRRREFLILETPLPG